MKKSVKTFVCGFVTCAVLSAASIGIFAESNTYVQALINNSVKVKLDGKDWSPVDPATGSKYDIITYNNRTYLPVRAIVQDGARLALDYDAGANTVWVGGKIGTVAVKDVDLYEDYYGTVLATDTGILTSPSITYQWGVTNTKNIDMQYFSCYLKPMGKYQGFKTSIYLDSSAKDSLNFDIRKETRMGEVIKSVTLKPGETMSDIDVNIGGMNQIFIGSNVAINHGTIKKIIIGEPVFYN
jgi:hypothetical protein